MLVVVLVFELVTLAVLGVEAPLLAGTLASTALRDLCLASPSPLVVGGPGGSAIPSGSLPVEYLVYLVDMVGIGL